MLRFYRFFRIICIFFYTNDKNNTTHKKRLSARLSATFWVPAFFHHSYFPFFTQTYCVFFSLHLLFHPFSLLIFCPFGQSPVLYTLIYVLTSFSRCKIPFFILHRCRFCILISAPGSFPVHLTRIQFFSYTKRSNIVIMRSACCPSCAYKPLSYTIYAVFWQHLAI